MFFLLHGRRTSLYDFLKFLGNLRKSSEVFGNIRKFSENFGNGSKVIFRYFNDFSNFRKIFGDIFTSEDMESILRGTRMYCDMDSMSALFSSKTLLPTV